MISIIDISTFPALCLAPSIASAIKHCCMNIHLLGAFASSMLRLGSPVRWKARLKCVRCLGLGNNPDLDILGI